MRKLRLLILVLLLGLCTLGITMNETQEVKAAESSQAFTGFKVSKGKTYYYKNGKKLTGLRTIEGNTYYFSSKGVMKTKGFKTVKGKKYYFGKDGKAYTGLKKISNKYYYFSNKGVMQYGLKTIKEKKYYFSKLTGVMITKSFKTVSNKKYYFGKDGKAYTGLKTINKNLYYFNTSGVMQKGWKKINSLQYYFQSSGKAIKNDTVKIGDIYANFDANGVYQIKASYCMINGKKMQVQYLTDPKVSDETLLAAILYAEAGGERQFRLTGNLNGQEIAVYKGQLAVGYTIMKRIKNRSYPNTLKEVVYAQYQFEPARTGVLTNFLNNPSLVSTDCKNTAKLLLSDDKTGENSVPDFNINDFPYYNFWALWYARNNSNFFSVYAPSEYQIIGNQVFFNFTKSISTK